MRGAPPYRVLWLGPMDGAERRAVDGHGVIVTSSSEVAPDAVVVAPGASMLRTAWSMWRSRVRPRSSIVLIDHVVSWRTALGLRAQVVIVPGRSKLRWIRRLVRHGRIAVVESPAAITTAHPAVGEEAAELSWAPTLTHVVASNVEALAIGDED